MHTFKSGCPLRTDDIVGLRRHMRQRRRSLSQKEQQMAAEMVCSRLLGLRLVRKARRIALYLSFDSEVATLILCQQLWREQKELYLPSLDSVHPGQMLFLPYREGTVLQTNRFGIQEPLPTPANQNLPPIALDIILLPLVAFDRQLYRIGMGGGYYDRVLLRYQMMETQTIGLAYDCQEVSSLPRNSWERPLSMVVTPSRGWSKSGRSKSLSSGCAGLLPPSLK